MCVCVHKTYDKNITRVASCDDYDFAFHDGGTAVYTCCHPSVQFNNGQEYNRNQRRIGGDYHQVSRVKVRESLGVPHIVTIEIHKQNAMIVVKVHIITTRILLLLYSKY